MQELSLFLGVLKNQYASKGNSDNYIEFYAKKNVQFTANEENDRKQVAIDYAYHMHTMDGCIERARKMLGMFKESSVKEKQ